MVGTRDPLNAFLDFPEIAVKHAESGPLSGLSFGVKDIFDVKDYPTGGGNPSKLRESPYAGDSAHVVRKLLDSGARFVGKTQTEELTYSMTGQNAHYPYPVNPKARDRVTGGSSSGSAAAVAGGLCDFALGSDTNGSIRLPAAFCGLIGLRTTHGRISMAGAMPLAPSFDTAGWFARDAETYERVGDAVLGDDPVAAPLSALFHVEALEDPLRGEIVRAEYVRLRGLVEDAFTGRTERLPLPFDLSALFEAFRLMQAYEAWQVHGAFITAADRMLGPGIRERFQFASTVGRKTYEAAVETRRSFCNAFGRLLPQEGVVVLPTQPAPAPLVTAGQDEMDDYRGRALAGTSIAGLLGWPQITIPLGTVESAPFGISLLARAGTDRQLIRIARRILGNH